MSCAMPANQEKEEAEEAVAADADDGDGGGWSAAPAKRPRQAERPKFVVCLDQARRRHHQAGSGRTLLMAAQPRALPLFPGCSDSESEDSDDGDGDDNGDAVSPRRPKFVLADVQCLLSYALLANLSLTAPRWCRLVKPNSVPRLLLVIVDSAAPAAAARLPKFMGHFYQAMRLMSPYACGESIGRELFRLPLHSVALGERQMLEKRLSLVWAKRRHAGSSAAVATIGTLADPLLVKPVAFPERDKFPRTELLLSSVQLLHENYPVPGLRSGSSRSVSYRTTLPAYKPATPSSPMYGLDCEMVVTECGPGGSQQLELARATLIDEAGSVLLDQLVKPPNPVVNYLTAKSGITREILDGATATLEDVQKQLSGLLQPDAILIGHSLNCDLHALQVCHPNCIDTSVIYNLSGSRRHKAGLKLLAQRFLGREIQSDDTAGHSSAEDAAAALELVQVKLARSLEFGDVASGGWSPAATGGGGGDGGGGDSDSPAAKRPRRDSEDADGGDGGGDFHASLRGGAERGSVSLFDWMQLRGVPFQVFDRRPRRVQDDADAEWGGGLPPTRLTRDSPDDAAAVDAARSEVLKRSRLVALRLRCLDEAEDAETTAAEAEAALAALDEPLDRLYEALPASSLSIVLFPGRRRRQPTDQAEAAAAAVGGASSARCYFNMKGMAKPQAWGKGR